ncbi:MAG: 23S rRNA (adenine(2030)-N(6))-methyltransferase RlmJ [Rickettsiaceae bacterium]|nr:23S rRNA (adenine(2030)-N(6))-methyltransferase RlmJ [Rickettsiaceae bacterium]
MNYRHIYHAGNWVDVAKHLVLIVLLENLQTKDSPFAVIDNFAGIALYDLMHEKSQKTNEAGSGIGLFLEHTKDTTNEAYKKYLNIIKSYNQPDQLQFYPGSPLIIQKHLRSQDRAVFYELHVEDHLALLSQLKLYKNIYVKNNDGYGAFKELLPLAEKRGLIFIDPCFEQKDEYELIINGLKILKQRARNMRVLIWYPIKISKLVTDFYKRLKELDFSEVIIIEIEKKNLGDSEISGLNKFGLMIINPPLIDNALKNVIDPLQKIYGVKSKIFNLR